MKMKLFLLTLGCLWSATAGAPAQNYSVNWFRIAGGGGSSTGGVFTVRGTLGQPEAGTASGGAFSLTGGFWALPVAVQETNAPALSITTAGPGFATIAWAPALPGFVLQSSPAIAPPAWVDAPSGPTNPVVVPATLPVRFYRLIRR